MLLEQITFEIIFQDTYTGEISFRKDAGVLVSPTWQLYSMSPITWVPEILLTVEIYSNITI